MRIIQGLLRVLALLVVFSTVEYLSGQETPSSDNRKIQAGHSVHTEAFDEGPRQAAYLMDGMGNVHWPVSTQNPMAQRFFDQGIVQLHGFWYFEAERSFRQAAAFDPDCAMFYWGMARANIENPYRSKGFIEVAMKKIEKANDKEKRLVEAWNKRVKDATNDNDENTTLRKPTNDKERKAAAKERRRKEDKRRDAVKESFKQYVQDLEGIATDFSDDIELKAMLVLQYWQNEGQGLEMQSHVAINALLSDILRINPRHPSHHFRIHVWDYRKESLAIDAAAKCGPSAPGIAHMWHMPGHTYSRLHRYDDAAWQQEASARVDHAHMIRDQVMPDQIHNYAHNNEWLIRDLLLIGRVREGVDLAKNMIELPRHPKYNTLDGRGSASLGRERLLNALTSYRRWHSLLENLGNAYLEATEDGLRQDEHNAWLAIAYCNTGDLAKTHEIRSQMTRQLEVLRAACVDAREALRLLIEKEEPSSTQAIRPPELALPFEVKEDPFGEENDPAIETVPSKEIGDAEMEKWSEPRKEIATSVRELEHRSARLKQYLHAIDAYVAASQGNWKEALSQSNHARNLVNSLVRMEWLALAGYAEQALERVEKRIDEGPNELLPLAIGIWIAAKNDFQKDKIQERCKKMIDKLSPMAAIADSDLELLTRIEPTVESLGLKDAWRKKAAAASDLGDRPPLDTLGPYRWSPSSAAIWTAQTASGEFKSTKDYAKRPTVLILYLGIGCLHCAEQLQEFAPMVKQFDAAGIDVIAISSESLGQLKLGLKNYDLPLPIPLMANPELDVFKAFRCFDDFEGQPLHGTFLLDTNNRIRWQDKGAEPFRDPKFLLEEAVRLLKL